MINPFSAAFQRSLFAPIPEPERAPRRELPTRSLAGGRISLDKHADVLGALRVVIPPPDAESSWRIENLDAKTLERYAPAKLMELLADLSPEVSRALWDYLRMMNPGYDAQAFRPGTETVDETAQKALDGFIAVLSDLYGSFDVVIGRLDLAAALRGAYVAELVLDKRGRLPIDLATPDPSALRFRKKDDPERGKVWQLCQYQGPQLVDLDRPTIRYIPVDPMPSSPYGRPIFSAALFSALFLLAMLHDLRRVVQQQGYPRLDIEVDLEKLQQTMPEDLSDEEAQQWLNKAMEDIVALYASLQPEDAYVHSTAVKVNRPVGAVDSSSLGAVAGLITALERMCVRALKTMPLLMSLDMTSSEAWANRQWEIHAAGVKALQHLKETLLERLFGLALQAQGIQATVRVRFAELRAAELLRDAQVEALTIENARAKYDNGWISQDQAAQQGADVEKADAPEPRTAAGSISTQLGGQPDPGSSRAALLHELREKRRVVDLALGQSERRNGHVPKDEVPA